jgi:hypothetical protein
MGCTTINIAGEHYTFNYKVVLLLKFLVKKANQPTLLRMTFYAIHLVEDENMPQPPDEIIRRQDPEEERFRLELDDEICLEKINDMLAILRQEYWKVARALRAYYNLRLRESDSELRAYHTSAPY